ncbi:hypothetical protein KPK_A0195 (plasmid) [Klebsiella variicola]|uniref:Uncharacterized protein n=1 Tax=Klebsiella variicola (strain 342) TaxID=507522 RepID=B5RKB1_KLEV3|nr:hypothetical protein KPK_A0195 [Klebsiella variicola]
MEYLLSARFSERVFFIPADVFLGLNYWVKLGISDHICV